MIELSRTITFGQYINNGSALTQMDPRTKILTTILLTGVLSFINHFIGLAICLIFCALLLQYSHISTRYVLHSFKPFLPFLAFIYVMEVLFYNTPTPHRLLWHWWALSISWEGVITNAITIIRVLFLYYIVSMLMFSTSLVDLTDGLESLLSPLQKLHIPTNAFIMVLVIALKFVPIFITEVERLTKAQTARGVRFDKGNVFQRTLKLAPLLIPLFVSGFKRAEVLSTAMEARCYGSRPGWRRSKRRALQWKRNDLLTLTCASIVCLTMLGTNFVIPL